MYVYIYIYTRCEMNTYTDLHRQHDNLYSSLPFPHVRVPLPTCIRPFCRHVAVDSPGLRRERCVLAIRHSDRGRSPSLLWPATNFEQLRDSDLAFQRQAQNKKCNAGFGVGTFCSDSFVVPTSVTHSHW